jgi:hypothetical protein
VRPSPVASCTAGSSDATRTPTAAASTAMAVARSWPQVGVSARRTARPTASAAIAPRENERYTTRPIGALAPAAPSRSARARVGSPATRAASTKPIAANAPCAFQ